MSTPTLNISRLAFCAGVCDRMRIEIPPDVWAFFDSIDSGHPENTNLTELFRLFKILKQQIDIVSPGYLQYFHFMELDAEDTAALERAGATGGQNAAAR